MPNPHSVIRSGMNCNSFLTHTHPHPSGSISRIALAHPLVISFPKLWIWDLSSLFQKSILVPTPLYTSSVPLSLCSLEAGQSWQQMRIVDFKAASLSSSLGHSPPKVSFPRICLKPIHHYLPYILFSGHFHLTFILKDLAEEISYLRNGFQSRAT